MNAMIPTAVDDDECYIVLIKKAYFILMNCLLRRVRRFLDVFVSIMRRPKQLIRFHPHTRNSSLPKHRDTISQEEDNIRYDNNKNVTMLKQCGGMYSLLQSVAFCMSIQQILLQSYIFSVFA